VRARSEREEIGRRGRGGVVRRGGSKAPFYRVRVGAGWPDGEGNQAAAGGAPLWAIWFGGERKRRGVSGVKRGGGVQHHIWERRGQRSGTRLLEVVVVTVFGQLHPGEDGNQSGPTWQ
jgi:hypothetical protein